MSKEVDYINVKVDPIDKEEANIILKQLGINMTSFVNMALKQLIYNGGIPFEIRAPKPTKELMEALEEGEQILKDIKSGKRKGYHNVNDLFKSLNEE